MKNIFIASDHKGFELKSFLVAHLKESGYNVTDFGTNSLESCDYPDYAQTLCSKMTADDLGILICNTGIGMSIAANRYSNIRAALCNSVADAKSSRAHNNANVLVIGSANCNAEKSKKIFDVFSSTQFESGRHKERLEKIGI